MPSDPPFQLSPAEYKARRERGEPTFLLDVREPWEYEIANLGGYLIPLSELPQRIHELDPAEAIVVMCHHGTRSAHAVRFLRQNGFPLAQNLAGGIDRWSREIDPKVPDY